MKTKTWPESREQLQARGKYKAILDHESVSRMHKELLKLQLLCTEDLSKQNSNPWNQKNTFKSYLILACRQSVEHSLDYRLTVEVPSSRESWPGPSKVIVVAHAFNSSTPKAEAENLSEFEASLRYSSRATQRNSISVTTSWKSHRSSIPLWSLLQVLGPCFRVLDALCVIRTYKLFPPKLVLVPVFITEIESTVTIKKRNVDDKQTHSIWLAVWFSRHHFLLHRHWAQSPESLGHLRKENASVY